MRRFLWSSLDGLDMHNTATWPALGKTLLGVLVMGAVLVLGYSVHLRELQARLVLARAGEVELKQVFVSKAHQAAHLQPHLAQMRAIEDSFALLVRQLPGNSEVPGLLEDISRTGLGSGLEFEEIKLLPEVDQPFYIELPIQISATGATMTWRRSSVLSRPCRGSSPCTTSAFAHWIRAMVRRCG